MTPVTASLPIDRNAPMERFRPNPWSWARVAYLGFAGLFYAAMTIGVSTTPQILPSGLAGSVILVLGIGVPAILFFVVGVFLVVSLVTSGIQIDEKTLSWRTWRGRFGVPWSEVQDYYDLDKAGLHIVEEGPRREVMPESHDFTRRLVSVIVTRQGQCRFNRTWPNANELRARIAERAVNARTNEWALLGARSELDWPRTFDYHTPGNRWGLVAPLTFAYALIGAMVAWICTPIWDFVTSAWAMGWPWRLLSLGVSMAVISLILGPIPPLVVSCIELRRRWRQSIRLSRDGIAYSDADGRLDVRWSEIKRLILTRKGARAIVETAQGSFEFTASIRDYGVLVTGIEQMVKDWLPEGWQVIEAKRRNQINAPVGISEKRVFTYRARLNGSMLSLFSIACVAMWVPISPTIGELFSSVYFDVPMVEGYLFFASATLLLAWGWWRFFTHRFEVDDEGISQFILGWRRKLPWSDVQSVRVGGAETFTGVRITGANTTIRFSMLIENGKELAAEIERHTGKELGLR